MSQLTQALLRGDDPEAIESARAPVSKVIIHPPETGGDPPDIELIDELVALLQTAGISANRGYGAGTGLDPRA